jgi:hypothetical protein
MLVSNLVWSGHYIGGGQMSATAEDLPATLRTHMTASVCNGPFHVHLFDRPLWVGTDRSASEKAFIR